MQKLSIACGFLCALVCLVAGQPDLEVNTTSGILKGTRFSILNKPGQGYGFYAVPFAEPPIGNLRFAPPQPAKPWMGVRDATQYGAVCPQNASANLFEEVLDFSKATGKSERTSNEDCLHLNIYTPSLNGSRAVMVWIHGGGLTAGWATQYDGRSLALLQDVVMVTIQYRLGLLGFMSTGDDVVKGNMGLMDQVMALQWIQENIASFGGNPDQVTIFGESAGSLSVCFHLLSPKSRGLFKRAILQSGSLGPETASPPLDIAQASKGAAATMGCSQTDSADMLQCLRQLPDPDVFWKSFSGVFVPAVDGDYLPDNPAKLMLSGEYNKGVDVMLGTTDVEGYFMAWDKSLFINPTAAGFEVLVEQFIIFLFQHKLTYKSEMISAVMQEYAQNITGDNLGRAIAEFAGDVVLTRDIIFTLQILAANGEGSLYFYDLKQRPSISLKPTYIISDHGDDLFYCFGDSNTEFFFGYEGMSRTKDDLKMEDLMVAYWTNFAKFGNPNSDGLPNWPSYHVDDSYLILKVEPQVAKQFRPDRTRFWMDTFQVAGGGEPIVFPERPVSSSGYFITAHITILLLICLLHTFIVPS